MAKLPSGIRKVYNALYKLKAAGQTAYAPTPSEVKDYFESQDISPDSITDEQFNQAINYFCKGELSTNLSSVAEQSSNQPADLSIVAAENTNKITKQERQGIVSAKASQMNIELSAADIEYVADKIDIQFDTTLDDILAQTEKLLCQYADYKKQEGLQKIDDMFGRVYNHVQKNNEETSSRISENLIKFGKDVEQSQQDFKSSISNALNRLKVPGVTA